MPTVRSSPRRRGDERLSDRRLRLEAGLTWLALIVIIAAFCALLGTFGASAEAHLRGPLDVVEAVSFLLVVALLVYGGLVYGFSRVGYFRRRLAFQHASRAELDEFCGATEAEVAILVPSYKEEPPIIRQTLLSAALQEYPNRRVVVLIGDPPRPSTDQDRAALDASRACAASPATLAAIQEAVSLRVGGRAGARRSAGFRRRAGNCAPCFAL